MENYRQKIFANLKEFINNSNNNSLKAKGELLVDFLKNNPNKEDFENFKKKTFSPRLLKNFEITDFINGCYKKIGIKNLLEKNLLFPEDEDDFLDKSISLIYEKNEESFCELKDGGFLTDDEFEKYMNLIYDFQKENFQNNDKILISEKNEKEEKNHLDPSFYLIGISDEDKIKKGDLEKSFQKESNFEKNKNKEKLTSQKKINLEAKNESFYINKKLETSEDKIKKAKFVENIINPENKKKTEKGNFVEKLMTAQNKEITEKVGKIQFSLSEEMRQVVLFETFIDVSSEYKMTKPRLLYDNFKEIYKFFTDNEIEILCFYGDYIKCIEEIKKFFNRDFLLEIKENEEEYLSVVGITDGNKLALVLNCNHQIFNKKFDKSLHLIDFLRFMTDISQNFIVCVSKRIIINKISESFRNPFQDVVNNPLKTSEIKTKNSNQTYLEKVHFIESFNTNNFYLSNKNFGCRFTIFKKKLIKLNEISIDRSEFGNNNVLDYIGFRSSMMKFDFDSFLYFLQQNFHNSYFTIYQYLDVLPKKIGIFIKENKKEEYWAEIKNLQNDFLFYQKSFDMYKKKCKFYNSLEYNYIEKFTIFNIHHKDYIFSIEKRIKKYSHGKNKAEVIEIIKELIKKINDEKEEINTQNESYNNNEDLKDIIKKIINEDKETYLKKKQFISKKKKKKEKLELELECEQDFIFYNIESQDFKKFFVIEIVKCARKYGSKETEFDNIIINYKNEVFKLIPNCENQIINCSLVTQNEITIKCDNNYCTSDITENEEISVHSNFNLNKGQNIYFILKNSPKGKSTVYHFENKKNNLSFISKFSTGLDSKIYIESKSKLVVMYNNERKKINIGKLSINYEIGNNLKPLPIFNQEKDGIIINEIISLAILPFEEKIIFINQDYKLITYDLKSKKIELLSIKENTGGSKVQTKLIEPINEGDYYLQVKSSSNSGIFFLQSKTSIDIFDINHMCLTRLEIVKNEEFIDFSNFDENQMEYILVLYKNKYECYKIKGLEQEVQIKFNFQERTDDVIFNSLIDYFYLAENKYGPHSSFITSPEFTLLNYNPEIKKDYFYLNQYFQTLKLKNIFLENKSLLSISPFLINRKNLYNLILSRIPIHVATIEEFKLIPLNKGRNNYKEIMDGIREIQTKELAKVIKFIINNIDFDYIEDILKNWTNKIQVISIIGRQSSGKSYLLNRLFGTRFNVAANRCTDGIWMSLSFIETEKGKELFLIMDCEGLFNIRRDKEDEIKTILAITAVSDIILLNNDLTFNRNLQDLFNTLKNIFGKLNGKSLFKSKLFMIIRDVANNEFKEAHKEFMSFITRTLSNTNNFLKKLFIELPLCQCLVYFENEIFSSYIKNIRKLIMEETINNKRWENGKSFLTSFKIILSQILLEDNTDMEQQQLKIKCEEFYKEILDVFFGKTNYFYENKFLFEFENDNISFSMDHSDLNFEFLNQLEGIHQYHEIKNKEAIENLENFNNKDKFEINHFEKENPDMGKISENLETKNQFIKIENSEEDDDDSKNSCYKQSLKKNNDKEALKSSEEKEDFKGEEDIKYFEYYTIFENIEEKEVLQNYEKEEKEKKSEDKKNNKNEDDFEKDQKIIDNLKKKKLKEFKRQKNTLAVKQEEKLINPGIKYFEKIFEQKFENYSKNNHNIWYKNFKIFCVELISQRIKIVMNYFDTQLDFDLEDNKDLFQEIEKTKNKIKRDLESFSQDFKFCLKTCKNCERECVKFLNHSENCDCFTDHICVEICNFSENCAKNNFVCSKNFGHDLNHVCKIGKHNCEVMCEIADCENTCGMKSNHDDIQHTCLQKHPCNEKCYANYCKKECIFDKSSPHTNHQCNNKKCMLVCDLCKKNDKTCVFDKHNHGDLISKNNEDDLKFEKEDGKILILKNHICEDEHVCKKECQNEGICIFEIEVVNKVFKAIKGEFSYEYFRHIIRKEDCTKKLAKFEISHENKHDCGKDFHNCNVKCPDCEAFCGLEINHAGFHESFNHRNKDVCIFVTKDEKDIIEVNDKQQKKQYIGGESCKPEKCHVSCERKGRAHFHLKECPGKDNCPALLNDSVRHCKDEKFYPYEDKVFDKYLCEYYWSTFDWKVPLSQDLIERNALCNFYCGHKDHNNDFSFCNKSAWHQDTHTFDCTHKDTYYGNNVDIAFVMDCTGSMGSYIDQSKETIEKIVKEFIIKGSEKNIRFGFVAYQDHDYKNWVCKSKDFCGKYSIIDFINTIKSGRLGKDNAEAVLDGLRDCLNLSWRQKSKKFLFHIADAPPHGRQYINSNFDDYPEGCPCGATIEDLAPLMNKKKINYKLLKIGSLPNKMALIFKEQINSYELCDLEGSFEMTEQVINILSKDILEIDIVRI